MDIASTLVLYFLLMVGSFAVKDLQPIYSELTKQNESNLNNSTKYDFKSPFLGCHNAQQKAGIIIKTQESIKRGATFISSPKLHYADDCLEHCCRDFNCNTAVLKRKNDEMACYLFNCGIPNICLFSSNQDFSVIQFPGKHLGKQVLRGQEQHLINLEHTTQSSKMTLHHSNIMDFSATSGVLFGGIGQRCSRQGQACTAHNSHCVDDHCVCLNGFHNFHFECKINCREFEFECKGISEPCIAIYDRCDGIKHCKDGSDELNCSFSYDHISLEPHTQSFTYDITTRMLAPSPLHSMNDRSNNGTLVMAENLSGQFQNVLMNRNTALALSLTIALLLTLVIIIMCRLQCTRAKSRRRRFKTDADYLINGMYL